MHQDQGKIYGRAIARGIAQWIEGTGYVFLQEKIHGDKLDRTARKKEAKERGEPAFSLERTDMAKRGVTMDALLDCVDQLEEAGNPLQLRDSLGLQPYGGHSHTGLVITSRKDKKITCAITTNSGKQEADYDVMFEWYYDEDSALDAMPNESFMDQYWRLVGGHDRGRTDLEYANTLELGARGPAELRAESKEKTKKKEFVKTGGR